MSNTDQFTVLGIPRFGVIQDGDDIVERIVLKLREGGIAVRQGDIFVIASKIVSIAEGRRISLCGVDPRNQAIELAKKTGKDARLVELILSESISIRLATDHGPIIALNKLGLELTSAGIDRDGTDGAFLLPEDPDGSAGRVKVALEQALSTQGLAVVIADSDGRPYRNGSTVLAIGSAGLKPLRESTIEEGSRTKVQQETLVDLIAAAAGVVIGQRGRGMPVAIVRGVIWEPAEEGVSSILHG